MKCADSGLKGVLTIALLFFCAMACRAEDLDGEAEDMDPVRMVKIPYVEINNKQLVEVIEKEVLPICFPDGEDKSKYDVYLSLNNKHCTVAIEATNHIPWVVNFNMVTIIDGYMVYIRDETAERDDNDEKVVRRTEMEIMVITDGRCEREFNDHVFFGNVHWFDNSGWTLEDIKEERYLYSSEDKYWFPRGGTEGYFLSRYWFCVPGDVPIPEPPQNTE